MDSDPLDPRSSPSKRARQGVVSDSEEEERPTRSRSRTNGHANGNGQTKRRRTIPASSGAEESEEEDVEARRARKGKGRAVNGNHEEQEVNQEGEDEDQADENNGAQPAQPQYRPEYERHPDGYVTGSITKIKLIDFMTYDFVEFNPGPHLNMILGPNGTGKSTVAAGIAIGLGFKPEIMGRATDLKSYVKQGKEEAWTEIEVRSKSGRRDHVIWRRFTREEKSEWKLNGQPCTRKAVLEVVGGYGIQANNLCCFLAQDRVAEFAKMSPPLTLTETMRAAGDPRLTEWHQKLVVKGEEKQKLEEKLSTDISRRDQVKAQLEKIAPDVVQFENRQEQEKEAEILELLVQAAKATELKKEHDVKGQEINELKQKKKDMANRNKPMKDLLEEQTAKASKASRKAERTNNDLRDQGKDIKHTISDLGNKLSRCVSADDDLTDLKTRIRRRVKAKADLEQRRTRAQEILDEAPDDLAARINEKTRQKNDVESRTHQATSDRHNLLDKERDLQARLKRIENGINTKSQERQSLENVEKVREQIAIQANASIGYALEWIKQNESQFDHPVGKPPMISVNVPKKQYAWQVEQCLSMAQRSTFITQSQHDYQLLTDLNRRKIPARELPGGRWTSESTVKLNVVRLNVNESNTNPQRICTDRQLQEVGLDGVAIDYVEADPIVIAFLNENCNLHRAGVTQRSSDDLRFDELAKMGFWTWLTRNESIRATQSRYGSRAHTIATQPAKPSHFFNQVVDTAAVERLAGQIADLKREKVDCEPTRAKINDDLKKSAETKTQLEEETMRLEKEIKSIRAKSQALARARTDIDLCNEELQNIADAPAEAVERDRLIAKKMSDAQACIPSVAALAQIHTAILQQADDATCSGLRLAQTTINTELIKKKRHEFERAEARITREIAEGLDQHDRMRLKYDNMGRAFAADLGKRSKPVRDGFKTRLPEAEAANAVEQLENAFARITNELELSVGISANVVERHRRYKKEFEAVAKEVKEQEADLRKVTQSVATILSKFEPALDSLVSTVSRRFSVAFDRNGCAGDVRLNKDERGYEHWGLIPHVSFRDSEAMQPLTGHRQSGGERSYSTIMYLMALSEMARVPFSLVDEINQGMDQQAERTVFNQLVETTCDASAGQYFLITPKLLTGLTYHERMRVLVVNNGCWLPEGSDKTQKFGDIKGCLKRVRQSLAAH